MIAVFAFLLMVSLSSRQQSIAAEAEKITEKTLEVSDLSKFVAEKTKDVKNTSGSLKEIVAQFMLT